MTKQRKSKKTEEVPRYRFNFLDLLTVTYGLAEIGMIRVNAREEELERELQAFSAMLDAENKLTHTLRDGDVLESHRFPQTGMYVLYLTRKGKRKRVWPKVEP